MAIRTAVGQAYTRMDSSMESIREATGLALQLALENLGTGVPNFALVFTPVGISMQEVQRAMAAQVKNLPVFGFSTVAQFAGDHVHQRTITIALIAGDHLVAQTGWWPMLDSNIFYGGTKNKNQQLLVRRVLDDLDIPATPSNGLLLLAYEANQDSLALHQYLPPAPHSTPVTKVSPERSIPASVISTGFTLAGALVGNMRKDIPPALLGGGLAGEGGLAAAWLTQAGGQAAAFTAGVGSAHGWQPTGVYFQVTSTDGNHIRTLNEMSPAEAYSRVFSHPPQSWTVPPLNELVRLYPLGIETHEDTGKGDQAGFTWLVASPIRVESDGSFLMSKLVPRNSVGHLLVSNAQAGFEAAQQATQQAIKALGVGRPVLALVLADLGWKLIFDTHHENELTGVRSVLGPDVPIVGGYTLGQVCHQDGQPVLLNQHILVIVIGERSLG